MLAHEIGIYEHQHLGGLVVANTTGETSVDTLQARESY
jgi:hypothetical protein